MSSADPQPPDRLAVLLRNDVDFVIEGALLVIEYASAEAVATLRRAGIRSILLEGPLQQRWLADAGTPRASIDVDLLIARADFEAAESAIAANGYSTPRTLPSDPGFDHARVWTAPTAFRLSCTGRSSAPTNAGSGKFSKTRRRPRRSQVSS